MEKKLTIIISIMLLLTLIIIVAGNRMWNETSRNITGGNQFVDNIEDRFESPKRDHIDSEPDEENEGIDQNEEIEEIDIAEEQETTAEQVGIIPTSKIMYTTAVLNVREDATTESGRIGRYAAEEMVTVTGEVNNGWVQVDFNGEVAYVLGTYLTSTEPEEQQPQQPRNPQRPSNPREPSEPDEPSNPSGDDDQEPDADNMQGGSDEDNEDDNDEDYNDEPENSGENDGDEPSSGQ